jgi:acyl-CoA synthetase (AMP-forming)/AMP-acid ligase II
MSSTLPSLPIPTTLTSHFRLGALRSPDRIAIAMLDGPAETYSQLEATTNRVANAILGAGIPVGERVAIWMDNDLSYLHVYFACLKTGHVVVQVNVRHTAPEASYQIANSGAVALFFDDSVAERVEKLEVRDQLKLLVTTGEDRVSGAVRWGEFRDTGHPEPVQRGPRAGDLAVIAYTSGTTGFPKGAELTQHSIRTLGTTNVFTNRYVVGSTQIFPLSLSFGAGIPSHVLPHLQVGGTSYIMKHWDTERLVAAIDEHRATFSILPSPPIPEFCDVVEASGSRLETLVSVLHSTAKAPEEHLERLVATIGPKLVEGWGMTENSGGLVAATTEDDYRSGRPRIYSSTGRPSPDVVVQLIDDDGHLLPHDGESVGQLVFHSGSLARGYWGNPEATAASFRDGWYHSGDLGTIDEDGYVYINDRRNDLIISGGMNVYPSEVERAILQFDGIVECAVVAAPHERWGQTPVAFVVRASDAITESDILLYAREQLAGYKLPTQIRFIDALPKNASNKVVRKRLRDQLDSEQPGQQAH